MNRQKLKERLLESCRFCGRCQFCGYTEADKALHLDHHLCERDIDAILDDTPDHPSRKEGSDE